MSENVQREWQGQNWYFIEDHGFPFLGMKLSQAIAWE